MGWVSDQILRYMAFNEMRGKGIPPGHPRGPLANFHIKTSYPKIYPREVTQINLELAGKP